MSAPRHPGRIQIPPGTRPLKVIEFIIADLEEQSKHWHNQALARTGKLIRDRYMHKAQILREQAERYRKLIEVA